MFFFGKTYLPTVEIIVAPSGMDEGQKKHFPIVEMLPRPFFPNM